MVGPVRTRLPVYGRPARQWRRPFLIVGLLLISLAVVFELGIVPTPVLTAKQPSPYLKLWTLFVLYPAVVLVLLAMLEPWSRKE